MLLKKNNRFILISLIFFLSYIILFLRYHNNNFNFFDFGNELYNSYKFFNFNDINYFSNGHIKIFQLIFYPLFIYKNTYIIGFILLLFKVLCFYFLVLYVKNKNIFIITLLPILWITLLYDFHYDVFCLPLFIFYDYYLKKNKNFYLISILFILIKEYFVLIPLITAFYLILFDRKNLYLIFLIVIVSTSLFIFLILNLSTIDDVNSFQSTNHYFSFLNNFSLNNFKNNFFFLIVIFSNFLFINFSIKNYYCFLLLFLSAIFLICSFFINFNVFSHYYLIILPIILILSKSFINFKLIILIFLLNILFSTSPLSYVFWFNKYFNFHFSSLYINNYIYFKKNILNEIDLKNTNIVIQNNFFFHELLNSKSISVFPENLNKDSIIFIDLNKDFFMLDKISCYSNCNEYLFDEYLYDKVKYNVIYSGNNIYIIEIL